MGDSRGMIWALAVFMALYFLAALALAAAGALRRWLKRRR